MNDVVSQNQKKYFEEYEKYKHIPVVVGIYQLKKNERFIYEVVSVDESLQIAYVKKENITNVKTLHWCRKNLKTIE